MSGPNEPLSELHLEDQMPQGSGRIRKILTSLRGSGLRARTLRGASWVSIGFGAQQVLRLGSNLILTRLLFPEVFGLMALAQVFAQGLAMLSDIGVGPSIVQNPRGADPDFLATAWTMQVIRGFILFFCMCLLAYPASIFYDEPLLLPILVLLGVSVIVQGFQSIGVAAATRSMQLGRLALLDFLAQMVGNIVMIVWAYYSRDVWALVGGGIIAAMIRVLLGYMLLDSKGSRFHFERDAAGQIFQFGFWIFLATAMTYLGGQGLRLIQGSLVSFSMLGLIAIAGSIAMLGRVFVSKVVTGVLFPAMAELDRNDSAKFIQKVRSMRFKVMLASSPFFVLSILFGKPVIAFMYDERYEQAGLFFVIISAATAVHLLRIFFAQTLFVKGDSYGHAYVMFFSSVLHIIGVIVGYLNGGVVGMLWGGVVAEALIYPVAVLRVRKHGIWSPGLDILLMALYIGLCAMMTYYLM